MAPAQLLDPYRVIDLTTGGGWLCGRLLADLGAEVIKVEPPGGDPGRLDPRGPYAGDRTSDPEANLAWWAANRGKASVVIDLDDAADRARFDELVAGADSVVESWGPGGMAARGLDPDELLARHPHLVVTSISPFGSDGPYAAHRGPDLVVTAQAGQVWLTGDADRPPVRVSAPQSMLLASAEAAVHTLVALQHAARTGQGQRVDAAALTAVVRALMNGTEFKALMGWEMVRSGSEVAYAPNRPRMVFRCADGHITFMCPFGALGGPGVLALMEWADKDGIEVPALLRGLDVLDSTIWADLEAAGHVPEVVAILEGLSERVFATRTKDELYRDAVDRRLLLAPVSTAADLHHDRQLAARDYWQQVDVPGHGTATFPGPWAVLSGTPLQPTPAPPTIGQHNATVTARPRRAPVPTEPAGQDPFAGLKVWDMSWVGVGPLTARYLADYGATVVRLDNGTRADVLRVNPPFRDGVPGINRSGFYADFNASKLGLGLDLAVAEAREVALRMTAWADVVLESFTPHALRSMGLHYDALREVNPSVVMLSTCMQGQTGPHRDYRGFGQLMGGLTGFYQLTGWPDRDPAMVFGAYTDFVAQRFCATALIAALDHRRRTGQGQHIDVSQLEASINLLGPELLDYDVNGRVATRQGNRDPRMAPHGVFPCRAVGTGLAGERWVAIAVEDDDQWQALVEVLDRPTWATDPALHTLAGRKAAEDGIEGHLAAWTADQDAATLAARLQPKVAAAPVNPPDDLHRDPQLAHLGYFETLDHPVMGPTAYNGMQARLSATPGWLRKPAPCLGEDTLMVLSDLLGYDDDEIGDLFVAEAIEIDLSS